MTHQLISVTDLKLSPANMRKSTKENDFSDILPSIRKYGVLQNIGVRKNCKGYEVVWGGRRFTAAQLVSDETGSPLEIPCKVIAEGDDAEAMELSALENAARLDPDPIAQYQHFAKLHKEGRSVEEIAIMFGFSERGVNQRMALGNLIPGLIKMFNDDQIDMSALQTLTMASKAKQKKYVQLHNSETEHCPSNWQLKGWIFDNGRMLASKALFPIEDYKGGIVDDLFASDEEAYFTNIEQFWMLQNKAIAERKDTYLADGWGEVEIITDYFCDWQHVNADKSEGGRVYIVVDESGSVEFHEGMITEKEYKAKQHAAEKKAAGDNASVKAVRPELTKAGENYFLLHRHAAVRDELARRPNMAFRLMVATFICELEQTPCKADKPETADSVANSVSSKSFAKQQSAALKVLGSPKGRDAILAEPNNWQSHGLSVETVFAKLTQLSDAKVMQIAAVAMAENLDAGGLHVDVLGELFGVDMSTLWHPDDACLDLIKDKGNLLAMLESAGSKELADANITATGKVTRSILKDLFSGSNGRKQVKNWIPNYLKFPFGGNVRKDGLSEIRDKKIRNKFLKSIKLR